MEFLGYYCVEIGEVAIFMLTIYRFECLEELYAADNNIKDLSSCAFLSSLKILDIRR